MITDSFIREMEEIVGQAYVSVSRATTELYSYDASLAKGKPGVVVFPADTDETVRVVRTAHRQGVTFVPRGFGTNLSGGTIVAADGLIIVLSRLNQILGIYPESRYAVVQPGVTNMELQDALAPLGFFYAPDPASQKVSTIGGNAGENSGGPRCLKYGVTLRTGSRQSKGIHHRRQCRRKFRRAPLSEIRGDHQSYSRIGNDPAGRGCCAGRRSGP